MRKINVSQPQQRAAHELIPSDRMAVRIILGRLCKNFDKRVIREVCALDFIKLVPFGVESSEKLPFHRRLSLLRCSLLTHLLRHVEVISRLDANKHASAASRFTPLVRWHRRNLLMYLLAALLVFAGLRSHLP